MITQSDKNMGGVDRFDQMLKSYFSKHRNKKWTVKFSIYIIHMLIHNSYVLYKEYSKYPKKVKKHLQYRMDLIEYLSEFNEFNFNYEHCTLTNGP
ncbi:hypothetical protein A3Q56_08549 [Intoshia linei]|uniref:PiggyBac transposable element-derived protein domain-containing protein n=1 Tax=Intoshia linei TaxID=1819745 RepID=A0A177AQU0_9BILA|nr:hypothetical protein A3Q56_08549 [Intoshia linei]